MQCDSFRISAATGALPCQSLSQRREDECERQGLVRGSRKGREAVASEQRTGLGNTTGKNV